MKVKQAMLQRGLFLILICLLLGGLGCGEKTSIYAPDFSLLDTNGKRICLSDLRGKAVILDFFSVSCQACARLIPNLEQIYNKYKNHGLVVLGINLDFLPNPSILSDFAKKEKISYPVLIGNNEIVMQYGGISVLPYVVFIDRNGKIDKVHQGYIDLPSLEKLAQELLVKRD